MATDKLQSLNTQGIGMILGLFIQYLLGIATNLFVQFPQNGTDKTMWEFAWRQLPLALHIIIGILLFIGAIVLVIRCVKAKNHQWIIVSSVGMVAILFAGVSGAIFIPHQTAMYSFSMAVSFIVALLAYFWGLYKGR